MAGYDCRVLYKLLFSFIASAINSTGALSGASSGPPSPQQIRTDELVLSCQTSRRQDEICRAIVVIKNVGDDSVEAVKEFVQLGSYEYAALTAINVVATGRLRLRSKSFLFPNARHIYDIRRDEVTIVFEAPF